jgi:hypothetical protein
MLLIIVVATVSIIALAITFFLTDRSRWRKILLVIGIVTAALSGLQAYNNRERAEELKDENLKLSAKIRQLQTRQEYSNVARYDVFGLLGLAGVGLTENPPFGLTEKSPLNDIFGRYVHNDPKEFHFDCTPDAVNAYTATIKSESKLPFPYYYRGVCSMLNNVEGWQHDLDTAREILAITTQKYQLTT